MSYCPWPDPVLRDRETVNAIETLIVPRGAVDLGEMEVRRALPSTKRQMGGPFGKETTLKTASKTLYGDVELQAGAARR